ncbi:hypothetical protein FHS55_003337 [Angulomicrobium tetraedrale]|uniref:Sulfatase N-terminal domain-containing protein n=1 Tax=Ancylobacter tetraedralis TaxID=217068 RepID=A0A839ZDH8_9HYPH|nr:hypothetical protein [Ancylobacter tetraedralis]
MAHLFKPAWRDQALVGLVLKKLEDMGQLDNTIVVFTTDNGAPQVTFPDGGVTPFKGQKGGSWEGGFRSPMMKKQIEAGAYPGIVKTTLDGFDPSKLLLGTSDKSAREAFFFYSGATPSAARFKNWKMYYDMTEETAAGWILPRVPFRMTLVQNIQRDPFEQAVGIDQKTVNGIGGALGSPLTAYIYDWNILPIGQQLWCTELMSYKAFPPMQAPETSNLDGLLRQVQSAGHPSDRSTRSAGRPSWVGQPNARRS